MTFSTSAFLPMESTGWQQFKLNCSPQEWEKIQARREKLEEDASRTGHHAKLRKFDRRIVLRHSSQR